MLKIFKKSKIYDKKIIKFNGIYTSDIPNKKFKASFNIDNNEKIIYFGNINVNDYTEHLDIELKQKYIVHNFSKEWCKPMNEKSLNRWILFNKCTLNASIDDYKKRFLFN